MCKHKCRRITKWKDNPVERTITFIINDFETDADVLCEVYRRRWQIEPLFKRLKQNFQLKYFLGDNHVSNTTSTERRLYQVVLTIT